MPDLKIDGNEYDLATSDTYTLDEWKLITAESGLTVDEVEDLDGKFHPGVVKAMLVITIQRARPEASVREITERIGKLTVAELGEVFVEDDDAVPPTEPQSETDEPPDPSGETGTDGSENGQDVASLVSTGHRLLVPTGSDPTTSAG